MQRSIGGHNVGILSMSNVAPLNYMVINAGSSIVNGLYLAKGSRSIPDGFTKTCEEMGWNNKETWGKLSNQVTPWWKHKDNDSYIYYNISDQQWWLDGPSGAGLYVVLVTPGIMNDANMGSAFPPKSGWKLLKGAEEPAPTLTDA